MARCCASRDARYMPVSPKRLRANFAEIAESQPELARASLHRGRTDREGCDACGARLDSGRWRARRWWRPWRSFAARSTRWRTCPPRQPCAASRSNSKLRSQRSYPRQRICCARDQGRGRSGTSTDRASRRRSESLPRTACCCSRSSMGSGSRTAWRSTAMRMRELATQFLALAEKQKATVPLMNGHRVMGISLVLTGDISEGAAHLDQAIALYDATEHRPLAMRFGADVGVSILSYRSLALWLLGYPDGALADSGQMLNEAREIGQSATTMFALQSRTADSSLMWKLCGGKRASR